MKVAFIANSVWYLSNFRASTLEAFSRQHAVSCLFPAQDDPGPLARYDVALAPFFLDAVSTHPVKEGRALLSLFNTLRRVRPAVVYSFNPKTNLYALIACWLLRLPCVPNVSGVGVASQLGGLKGRLYRGLAGFFYRRAWHVFFQNRQDREAFLQAGWVSQGKSEVIPGSGVDLSRFSPTPREPGRPVRFLMAARLLKAKGVPEYLQAARDLQAAMPGRVEFLLAGGVEPSERGVPEAELVAWGQERGMRFLGHVADMPALLGTVDCVVLPSYYPEGVPRSLIEAAAGGKLIVTTAMPGCQEVVLPGENGWCVPPRDVPALRLAMQRVAKLDAAGLARMGQASRALAEQRFDENLVIERYWQVLPDEAGGGADMEGLR
ncbi:glycosyltransferase family 4 protein [Billgrantia lactosivorans]|uniref:glycosyltransferase family 4 protein n=1 Tax=Billgrantia lactosivorans TaxID=2185141 RepID=UPI000DAD79E0|nr:glycosyltransferase family 4 protein [Halomonas lactosivorans]